VDEAQWTNVSPGFNVEVTDGQETWEVRIDEDTDIFGTSAPQGHFSVAGIGGQFDSSEPYDSGYQLLPRYLNDFSEPVVAYFTMDNAYDFGDGQDVNIEPLNQSSDGTLYVWNFGDGTTSFDENPAHTYDFDFLVQNPIVTITLTVTGAEGCTDTYSMEISMNYISISELSQTSSLRMFPNPANDQVTISWQEEFNEIVVSNVFGQTVRRFKANGQKTMNLDLSLLAPGQYQVTAYSNKGIATAQLQKI
jgi:PKD repeat protein